MGYGVLLFAGFGLGCASLAWFSQISADGSYLVDYFFPSLLVGGAVGIVSVTVTAAAMADVATDQTGLASGLLNTATQVGLAVGLCTLVLVADVGNQFGGGTRVVDPRALTHGYATAFACAAAVAAAFGDLSLG
jgi:Na+-transporting methylmalonyl-CoA/oxaloacetate decarboxylase beta subunit